MCGRYTLAGTDASQVRARFPVGEAVTIVRRFNVAPGDPVLAVTADPDGRPRGEQLRWGLIPPWADDPATGYKMINARAETVGERPAYRQAFERRRCLVIADGFYEWQRLPGAGKQPFHITRAGGGLFAFAGLWSSWRDPRTGSPLRTCTIITTVANAALAEIHDRMPVILGADAEAVWLEDGTPAPVLHDLLRPLPVLETELRPVGLAVGDARYDGPECLAAARPAQGAQAALF